jgi:hypothetical protein
VVGVGAWLWLVSRLALAADVSASETPHPSGPGWKVETGSPDALCPDLGLTEAALERRLGTLVTAPGAFFRVRYTIGHAPQGNPRDFVHLELFAPDGTLQLSRDLPLEGQCATMADVIAVVIDGHFRPLPHEEPEPRAMTQPALPAPAPIDEPERAPVARESTAGARLPLVLGAELAARHPVGPVIGLRATAQIARPVYLTAGLGLDLRSRSEPLEGGGRVSARGAHLQLSAGYDLSVGPVHALVGPSLRFIVDRGSAEGLPVDYTPGSRAVIAPGLFAGVLWCFHERLALSLTSTFDWSLPGASGRFAIDGRDVLEPPGFDVGVGVGLGYAFAP